MEAKKAQLKNAQPAKEEGFRSRCNRLDREWSSRFRACAPTAKDRERSSTPRTVARPAMDTKWNARRRFLKSILTKVEEQELLGPLYSHVFSRSILIMVFDTGIKDGQKITFHGEGDQEPGLEPGDVIIVLDIKKHPVFQRQDDNLIMKMKIKLVEALCGFKKTIHTLDNRLLLINSPPGMSHELFTCG